MDIAGEDSQFLRAGQIVLIQGVGSVTEHVGHQGGIGTRLIEHSQHLRLVNEALLFSWPGGSQAKGRLDHSGQFFR